MTGDYTQPIQYRGSMATCDDCGRLHVQGVACTHGEDNNV
jgi:hypothetical protein